MANFQSSWLRGCVLSLSALSACLSQEAASAATFSVRDSSVSISCAAPVPDYRFALEDGHTEANVFLAMLAATVAENWTDAAIRRDLKSWGLTDVYLIGKPWLGAYGYIAEGRDFRILAFRGTHSIPEGLIDATATSTSYEGIGFPGRGHTGMGLSFRLLWTQYAEELAAREKSKHKPLLVVGHSLGGSLAMLNAARLVELGYDVHSIYTLAQPRLGNAELMHRMNQLIGDRLYRLENDKDPVPHLPPTPPNAELFADVFATPGSMFHDKLIDIVKDLDYAPLPGKTLEMTAQAFVPKVGIQDEMEGEAAFILGYQNEVVGASSFPGLTMQFAKRVIAHIGDSYICRYLDLVKAGQEPRFP